MWMAKLGVQLPMQDLVFCVYCGEQFDDGFFWLFSTFGKKDDAVGRIHPSFCTRRNLPSTTCPSCGFQFSLTRSPEARPTAPALLYANGARGEEAVVSGCGRRCGEAILFGSLAPINGPLTALAFAEICQEIGLPAGVVNIVTGDGATGARW